MSRETKPLLSIGMIFRDDIRSIERCLESLRPLREAIPCELVMADTGSADGSRAVAERYADILFDFPWVDDFSAARNAVMDRASGTWFLTVDADEWLDGEISELTDFLLKDSRREEVCTLVVRNYSTSAADSDYADLSALRMARLSTGFRYHGSIHETFAPEGRKTPLVTRFFSRTILHHDGYADAGGAAGIAKRKRNIRLLRSELEKTPDSLWRLQQFVESGKLEPDYLDRLRQAAALVEARHEGWQKFGPPILYQAVGTAAERALPELEAWLSLAERAFPASYTFRIDIAYLAFLHSWSRKRDWQACIRWGEIYMEGIAAYEADPDRAEAAVRGVINRAYPAARQEIRLFLAAAYMKAAQMERAMALLEGVDASGLDARLAGVLAQALLNLHGESWLDTAPLMETVWRDISACGGERLAAFLESGGSAFSSCPATGAYRPAYTVFLPLAGRCELGTAAAVLESRDGAEAEALLRRVERWERLPAAALVHALALGVPFPLPDRPLALEEMDSLLTRMAAQEGALAGQALRAAARIPEGWQAMVWDQKLILAAVQSWNWTQSGAEGMDLCRAFARIEGAVLPRYYARELLEQQLCLLPPLHRFGWHCARSFEALDGGDAAGYVRCLRAGLDACPAMQPMVEFLTAHTPQLQAPSAELAELAQRIRTLLSQFAPGSAEAAAVRSSPAYRRAAHLIEGDEGGLSR